MKKIIFMLSVLSACTGRQENLRERSIQEIMNADLAMSDKAGRDGFYNALLAYADENVIKPAEGEMPIIGRQALEVSFSKKKDLKTLSWKPTVAEASQSGDLGFTFGNWKLTTGDTVYYGNYYTVWKRQGDGNWKFIFDAGNNTPANTSY